MQMNRRGEPRRAVATIKDIARELGVSHSTVSRALNDSPRISKDTKTRVHRIARELNYVGNSDARTLRLAHRSLIGLIGPDMNSQILAVMVRELAASCRDVGYRLVLSFTEEDEFAELEQVKAMRQDRVLGIVIVPSLRMLEETAHLLSGADVVQFSRINPLLDASAVTIDGGPGIAAAVEYLVQLGHRRIGYIGLAAQSPVGAARAESFRQALAAKGLSADAALVHQGAGDVDYGRRATMALLQSAQRPTAIIFGSTESTQGGYEMVRRARINVPRDLSLVGFGDSPWLKLLTPTLTNIAASHDAATKAAISLLLQQIKVTQANEPVEPRVSVVQDTSLIVGESTAPAPPSA